MSLIPPVACNLWRQLKSAEVLGIDCYTAPSEQRTPVSTLQEFTPARNAALSSHLKVFLYGLDAINRTVLHPR
jgi:hypothetical protein